MILILSFLFYKIVSYTYMSIRIAINSDVRIHNCWEWEHIPIWWSWKVKNLRINDPTCYYTPWVRSFDLSRYKNLKTLDVGERSFRYANSIRFESENMELMMR